DIQSRFSNMASAQSLLHSPASPRLATILQHFPPVTYAFAYGSGAHYQPGLYDVTGKDPLADNSTMASETSANSRSPSSSNGTNSSRSKGPVLDFIFAVKDAHQWHEQNLKRNPEHYSWVGRLGPEVVCGISEAVGVGVHFNTLVQLDAQTTIKYGVIEADTLHQDLSYWTSMYIAGRLHKPVTPLTPPASSSSAASSSSSSSSSPTAASLEGAQLLNRHHALATALLLLPPTFTEEELLRTIVGLSYRGDVRLAVRAEDPAKVERITAGSWAGLRNMYLPLIGGEESSRYSAIGLQPAGEVAGSHSSSSSAPPGLLWRQDKSPASQQAALQLLPPGLLLEMAGRLGYHVPLEHLLPGAPTQGEVVAAALRGGSATRLAADSLAALVRRASIYQAAAGLLAAGGGKAVQYVGAKLGKALRPLWQQARQQAGGR
ncbi:hypothetical protein Agub_g3444, partial [Astrephomene gubernaculifera]